MTDRCPSCGKPVPGDARLCQACGWDFVLKKKIKPASPGAAPAPASPPPAAKPPAPASPPPAAGGFSLPAARNLGGDAPAAPKKPDAPKSAPPDENPFALPVARSLGPKPGESLFSAPPPQAADEPAVEKAPAAGENAPEQPREVSAKKSLDLDALAPKRVEPAPPPEPRPEEPPPGKSLFASPEAEQSARVDNAPAPKPSPRSAADSVDEPPAKGAAKPARANAVHIAGAAGALLGLVSVIAIWQIMAPDPQAAKAPTGSSPFSRRDGPAPVLPEPEPSSSSGAQLGAPPQDAPPAPAEDVSVLPTPVIPPPPATTHASPSPAPPPPGESAAPAAPAAPAPAPTEPKPQTKPEPPAAKPEPPRAAERPTATFAAPAKPKTSAAKPKAPAKPKPKPAPAPAENDPEQPVVRPRPSRKGPQWKFEGMVYDLITTRGVYGARLIWVDADESTIGATETSEDGRYRVSLPVGPAEGYFLRVIHDDYSGKHIDELDSTSSLRKADLEQRKFLMQAGARNLPWIGDPAQITPRDLALVPRAPAE